MADEDLEFLSEHMESSHPLHAPQDFSVKVSERVLHLDRANYFLGSRDSDWHLPLLITLREEGLKNYRQRSTKGWKGIADKKVKFDAEAKDKKKGKGKGQSHDQSRASEQESKPWNSRQQRSVYNEPATDDWWSSWYDGSWSQGNWAGSSSGSGSWAPQGGSKGWWK